MTSDDVISSLNVIKYYNPNMRSLYDTWIAQAPNIALNADAMTTIEETGAPLWEALVNLEVELSNCIHDYVYNVTHPFDSVIVKNIMREQMTRDLFGFEANF